MRGRADNMGVVQNMPCNFRALASLSEHADQLAGDLEEFTMNIKSMKLPHQRSAESYSSPYIKPFLKPLTSINPFSKDASRRD